MEKKPAILVNKTFLPSLDKFKLYIDQIWENVHLTNHGPFSQQFEKRLSQTLEVDHVSFVTNGTLALQLAISAFDFEDGEIITTPFSYVATTSAILWERHTPVFVDIDPKTFCIDPHKIEAAITPQTRAIMAVHVFGYPCDVNALEDIAKRHNIKVIYDAAHAFGCVYKGRSLLDYGDVSTCSFHATKILQSIEGGCVISHSPEMHKKIGLQRSFGHIADDHLELGINAKASEFQAVMGLCSLDDYPKIHKMRQNLANLYDQAFTELPVQRPECPDEFEYNYAYYPVVFETSEMRQVIQDKLKLENIFARRYFYPSLNTLPYLKSSQDCPISESISERILCLPFYADLAQDDAQRIISIIKECLEPQEIAKKSIWSKFFSAPEYIGRS